MPRAKSQKAKSFQIKLPNKKDSLISKVPFLIQIYLALLTNIVIIILILLIKARIPPQIPLFYGLARGDKQLTSNIGLVIPSLLAIVIILLNSFISFFVSSNYLKKTLIITGFASTALSAITTIKILLLVGIF